MVREPAVAGQFYPGRSHALQQMLADLIPAADVQERAVAVMSPHAGYAYSGSMAGRTFADIVIPGEVVILGPNHHGYGHPSAVYARGSWVTPLGTVPIAEELAAAILRECPMSAEDELAHRYEHSLEVQVPFLQVMAPQSRIVPVCISRLPFDLLQAMGDGLARAMAAREERPLIVASSDMTHFETGESARHKDFMAIEKILSLDPAGLHRVVCDNRISMCGMIPTVVMLQAAIGLGATRAELVGYCNSGDVTGDQSDVVAYAGIHVY